MVARLLITLLFGISNVWALDLQVVKIDVIQGKLASNGIDFIPSGTNVDLNNNGIPEAPVNEWSQLKVTYVGVDVEAYLTNNFQQNIYEYTGPIMVSGAVGSSSNFSTPLTNFMEGVLVRTSLFSPSSRGSMNVSASIDRDLFVPSQDNVFQETDETNNLITIMLEGVPGPNDFVVTSYSFTQGAIVNPDIDENEIYELAVEEEIIFKANIKVESPKDPSLKVYFNLYVEDRLVGTSEMGTYSQYLIPGSEVNLRFKLPALFVSNSKEMKWTLKAITPTNIFDISPSQEKLLITEAPSLLFREMNIPSLKSWVSDLFFIPGWDHVGLGMYDENKAYESHPGYSKLSYFDDLKNSYIGIPYVSGVQSVHTLSSFLLNTAENDPLYFAKDKIKIAIPVKTAFGMREFIKSQQGKGFHYLSSNPLDTVFLPENQKGADGTFTCVGLIEKAAEVSGHNNGQGFVPDTLESIDSKIFGRVNLLSPQLLFYQASTAANTTNFIKAMADPVDFIVFDPYGRRLGYTVFSGYLNEIPNAFYTGDGDLEQIVIPDPVPGNYRIVFFGTGAHAKVAFESHLNGIKRNLEIDQFMSLGDVLEKEFDITKSFEGPSAPTSVIQIISAIPSDIVKAPVSNRLNNLTKFANTADSYIEGGNFSKAKKEVTIIRSHLIKWLNDGQKKNEILIELDTYISKY